MSNDESPKKPGEYQVGYARPPKSTRWKPGQSGNPKGKAKDTKSFKAIVLSEALGKITIKESGKPKTLTKAQVVVKTLMAQALQGQIKAIIPVLALFKEALPADAVETVKAGLSDEDKKILADHAAFLSLLVKEKGDDKA